MTNQNQMIKLGDIWMCDLGIPSNKPSDINVQSGKRPCFINSNNDNNLHAPIVNLIPLTSRLYKVYPMHVLIGTNCGLLKPSYTLPEQPVTKNKNVLLFKIGECDEITLRRVQDGILIQQGMKSIYNNTFKKNVNFDEKRVLRMLDSISQIKKLISNQKTNNKAVKLLEENLHTQIMFLKGYCEDFDQDVKDFYNDSISFQNKIIAV